MTAKAFSAFIGTKTVAFVAEAGYFFLLLYESLYWIVVGRFKKQPVRLHLVASEGLKVGIQAIPIVTVLCFSVGVMLAIQGIETLKLFGAESQVIFGITFSMTREFSPLIVGILIAGRSGSAITAKIGTMLGAQEIDALSVIGINPVRYLVSPVLLAMLIMLPALTFLGDIAGLLGGALYSTIRLDMTFDNYLVRTFDVLSIMDLMQGLIKSVMFSLLITIIAASNGFQVKGGAEGVGVATTRSVVLAISSIVMADMIFTYFISR
ncbi:MAG: ABC transporter permease [Gammaproteobacteria bacterium]|nr:ABC transporter permease [Gammaproteobacteria bacterium]